MLALLFDTSAGLFGTKDFKLIVVYINGTVGSHNKLNPSPPRRAGADKIHNRD
jgi:hypothetical protein